MKHPTNTALAELGGSLSEFLYQLNELLGIVDQDVPPDNHHFWWTEDAFELIEERFEELNESAPRGYKFAPHRDQPGVYGYWISQ
jgi:hypothetical protein